MYKDEIIAEVWRNRDAYARRHRHDLDEIVADLRKRQEAHPERVVSPRARKTGKPGTSRK